MIQPYRKLTVLSWSFYDFANQPFTTLIVTFIYGTFFQKVIAENEIVGTLLWSRGIAITAIVVALLSPIMGAIADRGGYRKFFLIVWTWVSIIGERSATTIAVMAIPRDHSNVPTISFSAITF
jgi:UMF1 family MFS transporter